MPLILNPRLVVKKQLTTIVLHEAPLTAEAWLVETLSAGDAILLSLFDGVRTVSDILNSLKAHGWNDTSLEVCKDRIDYFISRDILTDTNGLPSDGKRRHYDPMDFAFEAEVKPWYARLELPIAMTYICTRRCSLACRYCYAGATATNVERLLPLERILEIIDEAAQVGIAGINISGGEPFERPGIFTILEQIIANGICPSISTKACLGEKAISKLKELHLPSIQVSVDSSDPALSDYLVGKPGHHEGIVKTIRLLIQHEIRVTVNSVATSRNVHTLPELARLLNDLGVAEMYIAPYAPSLGRHEASLMLSETDLVSLRSKMSEIDTIFPTLVKAPIAMRKSKKTSTRMPDGLMCSAGLNAFILLPDGRVSICERLVNGAPFIVGDLRTQSIAEMWRSPEWERIAPARQFYEGTKCYSCPDFEQCTVERRRCFVNSIRFWGRTFGPEPYCPHLENAA